MEDVSGKNPYQQFSSNKVGRDAARVARAREAARVATESGDTSQTQSSTSVNSPAPINSIKKFGRSAIKEPLITRRQLSRQDSSAPPDISAPPDSFAYETNKADILSSVDGMYTPHETQNDDPKSLTAKLKTLKKVLVLLLNYCDKAKNKLDVVEIDNAVVELGDTTKRIMSEADTETTKLIRQFKLDNDSRQTEIQGFMNRIRDAHGHRSDMYKDIKAEIARCKKIIDEVIVGTNEEDSNRQTK